MNKYHSSSFILCSFVTIIGSDTNPPLSPRTLNWHTQYEIHSPKALADEFRERYGKSPEQLTTEDKENLSPIEALLLKRYNESVKIAHLRKLIESDEENR